MIKNFLVLATSVLLVAHAGCTKKKTPGSAAPSLTAKIDGRDFSASGTMVQPSIPGSEPGVTGVGAGNENISLAVGTFPLRTGTFKLDEQFDGAIMYGSGVGTAVTMSISGSVTILSVSPDWVGIFDCVCEDGTKITDGKFTVKPPVK